MADDLEIYNFEEDERYGDEKISYVIENDEYFFAGVLEDYGDERSVELMIEFYK